MNVKEYQKIVKKTAIYPSEIGLAYTTMGLVGEAGEVANKVKKLYRDEDFMKISVGPADEYWEFVKTNEKAKALKGELGDVLWYVAACAEELGITLEEIMQANYDKLMKRKAENKIGGEGDDR